MARNYNPNLVKRHRSYRVDEIARLFDCHKNTVLRWLRSGLSTIDNTRPYLVHGAVLRGFLSSKRKQQKQQCKPGELYCCGCRAPRTPVESRVVFIPKSTEIGSLCGACNVCGAVMNQYAKYRDLDKLSTYFAIALQGDPEHLTDTGDCLLNGDLNKGDKNG